MTQRNGHLNAECVGLNDVNLIPISRPHTFIDDTETANGDVRLTERDDIVATEVPPSFYDNIQPKCIMSQDILLYVCMYLSIYLKSQDYGDVGAENPSAIWASNKDSYSHPEALRGE